MSVTERSGNKRPEDRRAEVRYAASGGVQLTLTEPVARQVDGQLVDMSKSGFRASHDEASLESGQEIRFQHSAGKGSARVMWTRIIAGHMESGFLII